MRKYYLVMVEKPGRNGYEVFLTDSTRYSVVLAEIEATSYSEALKMVTFRKTQNGDTKYL